MIIKISVIIPVYNMKKYIGECLESVIGQDFRDMEIICVNDGSTDNSIAILKEYATNDDRVKIIDYKENKGLSFARNCGIKNAKGKYIMFVDSDDMITENCLKDLYDRIESTQADGVTFDLQSLYEDDLDQTDITKFTHRKSNYFDVCTGQKLFTIQRQNDDYQLMAWLYMWKRDFLINNNLFFHEGILHEDDPFTVCALIYAKRIIYLKKVCYLYRRRNDSITTRPYECKHLIGKVEGIADILRIMESYDNAIEYDFRKSLTGFLLARRHFTRIQLINLIRSGEKIELYAESFKSFMEWQSIMRADYYYISGLIDAYTYKKLTGYKKIIIYGIGKVGMEVIKLLEEYEIRNYVTAITKKNQSNLGLNPHTVEIADLAQKYTDALVLVAVGKNLQDELMQKAISLGFKNVVKATQFFNCEIVIEVCD